VAPIALNPLPTQGELGAFARAAAHLLAEHPTPALGARTVRRRAGVGLQHLDHRDYVPGDEVRHIDWRLTARLQRPIVRQFEAETSGDWFLVLDASSSMTTVDATWHGAVAATAAMAFALLELGHRVALLACADDVVAECPAGRGAAQYPRIARVLRAVRPVPEGARTHLAACAKRIRGTASCFVVSDFLGPGELRADLAMLRERSVQLHALLVHDATALRVEGPAPVELYDVETGAVVTSSTGEAAAAAAARTFQLMLQRLRRFAARSGIAFSAWDVAQPWQRALIDHLARARGA
jgi:uncharacterized protein (DUF58 family)